MLPPDLLALTAQYYVKANNSKIPHSLADYKADCYCASCSTERYRRQADWDSWKNGIYNVGYYGGMILMAGCFIKVFSSLKPAQQDKIADEMLAKSLDLFKATVEQAANSTDGVARAASAPVTRQIVDRAMEEARRVWPILQQRGIRISFDAVYAMIKSGVDPLSRYAGAAFMGRR